MITVVNKYKHTPTPNDVYIGRGSPFGNPYVIGSKYTRDAAVDAYATYLNAKMQYSPEFREDVKKLADKAKRGGVNLVCFCKPQRCHGEELKTLLEKELDKMSD